MKSTKPSLSWKTTYFLPSKKHHGSSADFFPLHTILTSWTQASWHCYTSPPAPWCTAGDICFQLLNINFHPVNGHCNYSSAWVHTHEKTPFCHSTVFFSFSTYSSMTLLVSSPLTLSIYDVSCIAFDLHTHFVFVIWSTLPSSSTKTECLPSSSFLLVLPCRLGGKFKPHRLQAWRGMWIT